MKQKLSESSVVELLLSKYLSDPEGFRSYLPEVAQRLSAYVSQPKLHRSPFGLTESERRHRLEGLSSMSRKKGMTGEEAIRALEDCAVLIEDGSLPLETTFEKRIQLVKAVIGKSPGSFKTNTTVPIETSPQDRGVILRNVPILRGVQLHLTQDMRLVAISVNPKRFQERRRLLSFVGIASDPNPDVAARHDDYLAEIDPHATS